MFFEISIGRWSLLGAMGVLLAMGYVRWRKYPAAPGPLLARFTNIWQAYWMVNGDFEKQNMKLHKKHGNIVRLGPDYYSIDDPDAARIIYGHGTRFIKSEWYRVWQVPKEYLEVNLFAQRDVKQHADARRRYANLYSMSAVVEYETHVEKCIGVFSKIVTSCVSKGESVDFTKLFQYYAFDVIGEITYSKRLGFMDARKDVSNMISTIASILEASQIMGLFPALLAIQPILVSMGSKSNKEITDYAEECVRDAKQELIRAAEDKEHPDGPSRDFCSKLLAMTDSNESKKAGLVDPDMLVQGACTQNVFAGSDTTSITLTATLFNIITRPGVLEKLRSEIDEAAGRGELSSVPSFAESLKLPYLQAVLKESLRVHPATGLPLWREVPEGGATLCGTWFPAGTNVGINSWVAHRNRDVWGADADEFRPERWIESTEEQLRLMNSMFMPFGLGSRTCIGKNISLLEISKLIPYLVRCYDISLADTVGEKKELGSRCSWFVKQKEFRVNIKERDNA